MLSQHLPLRFHSDKKWAYVRNLKHNNINPSKLTLSTGADVPEAFIQQDIKKSGDCKPLFIETSFGWAIFVNDRNAELDVRAK